MLARSFTNMGLRLPSDLPFSEWERLGASLAQATDAVQWCTGDWWAYGEHQYGERAKAAAESRFSYAYLANLGWVARTVEPSRRRENLSFGHHQCVASLPPDQQQYWLDKAVENGLSIRALRSALKQVAPPTEADDPAAAGGGADSQLGQVYELGPHRLICADATDPAVLRALLADERASITWTDPPYGVGYVGKTADALTIANDGADGLRELLVGAWQAAAPVLVESAPFYVAGPTGDNAETFLASFPEAGWRYQQMLIWVKNRLILGRQDYHLQHEAIYHGHGPGRTAGRMSAGRFRWYGGDDATSIINVASPSASREHPTMKPVELIVPHLLNSSLPDEIILDPFAGSGSTMIAAERTGRRAFMIELEPRYCDRIRKRWRTFKRNEQAARRRSTGSSGTTRRRRSPSRPAARPGETA